MVQADRQSMAQRASVCDARAGAEAHSTADQVLWWNWEVHVSHGQRGIETEALPDGGLLSYAGMARTLCIPAQSQATFILKDSRVASKTEASKSVGCACLSLAKEAIWRSKIVSCQTVILRWVAKMSKTIMSTYAGILLVRYDAC